MHAILRAFHLLAPDGKVADPNVQLARKLSLRLVKALLHGSRNGKIPDNVIGRQAHQSAFSVLEHIASDDPNAVKLWSAWSAVAAEKPADAFRAKQTLLELPIWHKSPCVFPANHLYHFRIPLPTSNVAWELRADHRSVLPEPSRLHSSSTRLSFRATD